MDIDVKEHSNILCLMNDSFDEVYSCLKKKKKALYSQLKETYDALKMPCDISSENEEENIVEITPEKIAEIDAEFEEIDPDEEKKD